MIYRLKLARDGEPVIHAKSCFCPSMSFSGVNPPGEDDIWEEEADCLADLAHQLNAHLSEPAAEDALNIAHCVAGEGIGKRYSGIRQRGSTLGQWVSQLEDRARDRAKIPYIAPLGKTQLTFSDHLEGERAAPSNKPGRPRTVHAGCSHTQDKKGRAACRRARAKA